MHEALLQRLEHLDHVVIASGPRLFATASTLEYEVCIWRGQGRTKFGKMGSGPGEFFFHPCAMAISAREEIYVCDGSNHRVQVFDASGKFLRMFGSEGRGYGQFHYPHAITVLADRVFVGDQGEQLQAFDEMGRFIWAMRDLPPHALLALDEMVLLWMANSRTVRTFAYLDGTLLRECRDPPPRSRVLFTTPDGRIRIGCRVLAPDLLT